MVIGKTFEIKQKEQVKEGEMDEGRLDRIENMLGYLIGRVSKIEKQLGCSDMNDGVLYGLINNINIDDLELVNGTKITQTDIHIMISILKQIDDDPSKKQKFRGYDDIRREVEHKYIKDKAVVILKYLNGTYPSKFEELFDKMPEFKFKVESDLGNLTKSSKNV